ncbi:MAG: hypothetical protein DDT34_00308 [Firmicutes bacterium]|nr:hypothetical protein [Bacillota bacterium]
MLVASSQFTVAPRASKIARIGTKVRPFWITGGTAKANGAPLMRTRIGTLACTIGKPINSVAIIATATTPNRILLLKHSSLLFVLL